VVIIYILLSAASIQSRLDWDTNHACDGRQLDGSITISPIKNSTGHVIGASKVIRDITE
jgi:hypothetical protein